MEPTLAGIAVLRANPSPFGSIAGFLKYTINNVAELELLMMHNRKYAAEIAHNVSTRKRKAIVERAAEVGFLGTWGGECMHLPWMKRWGQMDMCMDGTQCVGASACLTWVD